MHTCIYVSIYYLYQYLSFKTQIYVESYPPSFTDFLILIFKVFLYTNCLHNCHQKVLVDLFIQVSRIVREQFGSEGLFKDQFFNQPVMGRDIFNQFKALSNLTSNTYIDGASTTSLGNLFQCLNTFTVKNFFHTSNLNLSSSSLKSSPLLLLLQALVKSVPPS